MLTTYTLRDVWHSDQVTCDDCEKLLRRDNLFGYKIYHTYESVEDNKTGLTLDICESCAKAYG